MELALAVFIFAASTSITPGPNNVMIIASGLNHGVRKSIPHYLGICIGFPAMVALVGMGFGVVFERYPWLHEVIKIIGIVYLLYLAWQIANSAPKTLTAEAAKPISFIQAVLFQWVNPKAWMMATGAVAAYTSASGDVFLQVLAIALIFFIVSFPCIGSWMLFGVGLKSILKKPGYQRLFNIAMAGLLIISIAPVVVELITKYL